MVLRPEVQKEGVAASTEASLGVEMAFSPSSVPVLPPCLSVS